MDSQGIGSIVAKLEALASERGERYTPAPLLKEMAKNGERFYS